MNSNHGNAQYKLTIIDLGTHVVCAVNRKGVVLLVLPTKKKIHTPNKCEYISVLSLTYK